MLMIDKVRVYFSGNNLDVDQYSEVVDEVEYLATHRLGKNEQFRVLLVPISKSGTTLETLAAFSYFYEQCQKSSLLQMEVAVVTDLDEDISPLYNLAKENVWQCFDIKEGIGGRFCIFSDPGLITAAAIGMDIDAFFMWSKGYGKCMSVSFAWRKPGALERSLEVCSSRKRALILKFLCHMRRK